MIDEKFNSVSIQNKCIELDPGLYKAIQVIKSPFLPVKRNNQFLTQGQNLLLGGLNYNWQIVACWIINLQTGKLNPQQSPYNLLEFQDRKTWAQVLNAQLNLCTGVQNLHHASNKQYLTHYDMWIACMQEIREWQVKSIIEAPTFSGKQPILKMQQIQGIRKFVNSLENGEILLPKREDTKHHRKLLNTVIKIANSTNTKTVRFKNEYWYPYLNAYRAYATDIQKNSELKSVFPWKDGLAYQGKGRFSPITIPFQAKLEQILKQQSSEG